MADQVSYTISYKNVSQVIYGNSLSCNLPMNLYVQNSHPRVANIYILHFDVELLYILISFSPATNTNLNIGRPLFSLINHMLILQS